MQLHRKQCLQLLQLAKKKKDYNQEEVVHALKSAIGLELIRYSVKQPAERKRSLTCFWIQRHFDIWKSFDKLHLFSWRSKIDLCLHMIYPLHHFSSVFYFLASYLKKKSQLSDVFVKRVFLRQCKTSDRSWPQARLTSLQVHSCSLNECKIMGI